MGKKGYLAFVVVVVAGVGSLIAWQAGEKSRLERRSEQALDEARRAHKQEIQAEYQRSVEADREARCGPRVQMINASGEDRYICSSDIEYWKDRGWILRQSGSR